ncbi:MULTISPECIES: hypothetical protein [Gammaproteobacteria]|uniref:DUF4870 family protein n=1 Tax=Gammaproteobacteria TaxID=1236 RepID=UPI000DCFB230|nr:MULTISPECIES: hypothetical protein [Gammaproteobacteria]RTE87502.1 hypothetical protein DQX04_03735 [Aliidiomarina sp. B3213]TCZ92713.1 hypothetical protein EYQ95_01570 [Lysobacter sp. N42]
MSDYEPNTGVLTPREEQAKTSALIAYGLMVAGMFTGIFWIAGVIWAFIKRGEAVGTIFESHFTNVIKIWVWGLIWLVVGTILLIVGIGFIIYFAAWVWTIYRLVKGLSRLTSHQPYL